MANYVQKSELEGKKSLLSIPGIVNNDLKTFYDNLRLHHVLVGAYYNGLYWVCPIIEDYETFEEFEKRYRQGLYIQRDYYKV